ncbi:7-cyano-7-deazaguanine synthase [Candidatus Lokiarchaeum ossiferum]
MSQEKSTFIPNRVVLIASGGLDSTTLLYRLLAEKKDIFALTFNYGQKHVKEVECARVNCEMHHIPHKILSLESITKAGLFGKSSLTSDLSIPEGDYDDTNMMSTVVPNRNMIMISLALAYAISIRAEAIYYGAHAGDHAIYPDCRPVFVEAMQQAAKVCHYWPIKIHAPYLHVPKGDIVKEGLVLHVDYAKTWTCYKGGEQACGKCGSCDERLKAFEVNNVSDPLDYE